MTSMEALSLIKEKANDDFLDFIKDFKEFVTDFIFDDDHLVMRGLGVLLLVGLVLIGFIIIPVFLFLYLLGMIIFCFEIAFNDRSK